MEINNWFPYKEKWFEVIVVGTLGAIWYGCLITLITIALHWNEFASMLMG